MSEVKYFEVDDTVFSYEGGWVYVGCSSLLILYSGDYSFLGEKATSVVSALGKVYSRGLMRW